MRVEDIPIADIVVRDRRREDYGDLWTSFGFNGIPDHAYTTQAGNLIRAEIYPSLQPEHWHLAVYFNSYKLITAHPEWRENIAAWFQLRTISAENCSWACRPAEPSEKNPFDHARVRRVPRPRVAKSPEPKPLPAVVYFVQAGPNGLIKIGQSNNPQKRVKALATASALPLEPLGFMEGGQKAETALHRQFKHLREHGEWFSPAPELLDFINQNAKAWAFLLIYSFQHFISEVHRVGGIRAFVAGWSEQDVRQFLARICDVRDTLSSWRDELSDSLNDARAEAS